MTDPPLIASFSDARPDSVAATYARLYEVGQRSWRRARARGVAGR